VTHTRRTFLGGVASLAASSIAIRSAQAQTPTASAPVTPGAAAQTAGGLVAKRGIKLGLDHFAIRGFNWKAPQLIDYAASQKLDGIFLSELTSLSRMSPPERPAGAGRRALTRIGHVEHLPDVGASTLAHRHDTAASGGEDRRVAGDPLLPRTPGGSRHAGGIETHIKNTVEV
jgi:hypothetical protein